MNLALGRFVNLSLGSFSLLESIPLLIEVRNFLTLLIHETKLEPSEMLSAEAHLV